MRIHIGKGVSPGGAGGWGSAPERSKICKPRCLALKEAAGRTNAPRLMGHDNAS